MHLKELEEEEDEEDYKEEDEEDLARSMIFSMYFK